MRVRLCTDAPDSVRLHRPRTLQEQVVVASSPPAADAAVDGLGKARNYTTHTHTTHTHTERNVAPYPNRASGKGLSKSHKVNRDTPTARSMLDTRTQSLEQPWRPKSLTTSRTGRGCPHVLPASAASTGPPVLIVDGIGSKCYGSGWFVVVRVAWVVQQTHKPLVH